MGGTRHAHRGVQTCVASPAGSGVGLGKDRRPAAVRSACFTYSDLTTLLHLGWRGAGAQRITTPKAAQVPIAIAL